MIGHAGEPLDLRAELMHDAELPFQVANADSVFFLTCTMGLLVSSPNAQANMMTLAEHIIEATPERIKRENFAPADSVPSDTSGVSNTMNWLANYLGDVEQLPSIIHLR